MIGDFAFDHDLDLTNDYADPTNLDLGGHFEGGAHLYAGKDGRLRPVHDIGMPVLFVPYYVAAYMLTERVVAYVPASWLARARLNFTVVLRHLLSFAMIGFTVAIALRLFDMFSGLSSTSTRAFAWVLLLVLSPLLILQLRRLERSDPEICPRPASDLLVELQTLEDQDVTNQYTAFGSGKPGVFRRWLITVVFAVIQFTARYLFTRGYLGRVQTIHFARWVFVDNKRRVLFTSNYDGGHQAYMDDFINKVAWGLNVAFSSGIGWPHTDFLLARGARREPPPAAVQRGSAPEPAQAWVPPDGTRAWPHRRPGRPPATCAPPGLRWCWMRSGRIRPTPGAWP